MSTKLSMFLDSSRDPEKLYNFNEFADLPAQNPLLALNSNLAWKCSTEIKVTC